jgi:hypothetical protein
MLLVVRARGERVVATARQIEAYPVSRARMS